VCFIFKHEIVFTTILHTKVLQNYNRRKLDFVQVTIKAQNATHSTPNASRTIPLNMETTGLAFIVMLWPMGHALVFKSPSICGKREQAYCRTHVGINRQ
jgi:hypothetical protein